jgi:hypothetical protein
MIQSRCLSGARSRQYLQASKRSEASDCRVKTDPLYEAWFLLTAQRRQSAAMTQAPALRVQESAGGQEVKLPTRRVCIRSTLRTRVRDRRDQSQTSGTKGRNASEQLGGSCLLESSINPSRVGDFISPRMFLLNLRTKVYKKDSIHSFGKTEWLY